MITNVQIPRICIHGNHARIMFNVDGIPYPEADYLYEEFFDENEELEPALRDLRYCLNQINHTAWADIKTALE